MRVGQVVSLLSVLLSAAGSVHAASVPVGFKDQQIADGLTSPTALTALPDGRLLVLQQNGVIKVVKDDKMLPDSYWEVPNVDSTFERGCLGIVQDPGYEQNHYIYLYCSIKDGADSNNRLLRVTEADGHAQADSLKELLKLPPIPSIFHMGGALRFGTDGMLYVAVGNHEDDPQTDSNSQKLSNPFGKILRIRSDGSVPDDNPFAEQSGAYAPIWSFGYRNPFAFDIQPGTGRILVGDVGQGSWEEVDDNKRGANYGWPAVEGPSDDSKYVPPLYAYKHTDGHCALTGAAFYNPKTVQFPNDFVGMFLFEEFCVGTLEVLDPETAQVRPFASGLGFPVNMVVAPDGSLYYMSRNQDTMTHDPNVGTLSKISYTGTQAPRISKNPEAQTIVLGDPVTFSVMAQDAASIQWQRDGKDIAGATGDKYTIEHTSANDDGARFVAVAENDHGKTSSLAAKLSVTTNHPPKVDIKGSDRIEYAPGEKITLSGSATDQEDGDLPKSAYTWQADYQHDTHSHPLLGATSGSDSFSFMVPEFEAEEADTWVRAQLFAKDSGGSTQSTYRDLYPRTQLSSLTPIDPVVNGSGPLERDHSNGAEGMDGKTITLDGIAYNTGLGVHAPSDVRFQLDAHCSGKLVTAVGVDDEVADGAGSVVFQVFLDDKMAYDSGLKRRNDDRENVVLDVKGVKQLRLVVTDAGDGNSGDHADWGAARVTGCSFDDDKSKTAAAADSGKKNADSQSMPAAVSSKASGASSERSDAGQQDSQNTNMDKDTITAGSKSEPAGFDAGTPAERSNHSGGCSVTRAGSHRAADGVWLTLLGFGAAACFGRRPRRRRLSPSVRSAIPRR